MKKQRSRIFGVIFLSLFTFIIFFTVFSYENGISVSAFSSFSDGELNPMLTRKNSLIIVSPSETDFSTDAPVVTVSGYCLPDKPLEINSNKIHIEKDGSFKYDYTLESGENTLIVTNGDLSFKYLIRYDFSLIKSVSPQSDIIINSDMTLKISANALSGAKVYAEIGKYKLNLKCGDASNEIFKTFSADFTVPEFSNDREELGNIKFYAELGEHKEEKTGGKITILKSLSNYTVKSGEGKIVTPEILPDNTVKLLSPKEDHLFGNSQMCIVNKNYAEVVPASTADDRNDPRYTPYLSGTVDYITGECEYDKQEYYLLLSGVKIAKKNVEAFSGYIMPMNTVSSASVSDSSLTLTMNWKVPFTSQLKQQSYFTGHASRAFNIRKFTASYIDFVFKYTNAVSSQSISFGDNCAVSYAQWLGVGDDGTSTLRVFLREKGGFYGYRAYYSNDNRLVISFKNKPGLNRKIVIDPGHGGRDCGAVGSNGMYESNVNISIAQSVRDYLEKSGISVEFTRSGDSYLSLDERQDFARASGADMFIALHNNSSEDAATSGTEAYYYTAFSRALADQIHSELVSVWRNLYLNNSAMYDKIIPIDGGVRFFPYQVIRIEECPAVLIECGYLSNPTECELLCSDEVRQKIAKAISEGVLEYYDKLR